MSSATKVGIFMVAILGVLGFFTLKIEDISLRHGPTKIVKAIFDWVAGLDEKSTVRVAGVRKGKVTDVQLTPDGKAMVTMQIDGDVELHQGATARIADLGLLGEKFVELDTGRPGTPIIAEKNGETVLSGSQNPNISSVTSQVADIATDVKAITASLRGAIGGPTGEKRLDHRRKRPSDHRPGSSADRSQSGEHQRQRRKHTGHYR